MSMFILNTGRVIFATGKKAIQEALKKGAKKATAKQKRDFLHVYDLVDAIIKCFKSKVRGEIINIGYGKPYSVKYIINKIIEIIGKGKPLFGSIKLRKDEYLISYPKISKAKKVLNWKPKIKLKTGILNTIKYYKNEK